MRSIRRKIAIAAVAGTLVAGATFGTTYLAQADDIEASATTDAYWRSGGNYGGWGGLDTNGDKISVSDYRNDGHGTQVHMQKLYRGEWTNVGKPCKTSTVKGKTCTRNVAEGTMIRIRVTSTDGAGKGEHSDPLRA